MDYDLGGGKRLFDVHYNPRKSSSSSMFYEGRYEGDVKLSEIVNALGDGSFGHRCSILSGDHFTYVKVTD